MTEIPRIDASIYNPNPYEVPAGTNQASLIPAKVPLAEQVPIGETVAGSTLEAQGAQALAAANRVPVGVGESMRAATREWLPVKLYDAYQAPAFDWDENHKAAERLQHVDFELNQDQSKWLLETKSGEQFDYRLERIKEENENHKLMGDNSGSALVVSLLDPLYLGVSAASAGAGIAAKGIGLVGGAAKTTAGLTAGSIMLGAGNMIQTVSPITDKEVLGQALLFAAAEGVLFRAGKPVPADANFPAQRLQTIADDIGTKRANPLPEAAPDFVGPVRPVEPPSNLTTSRVPATGEGRTPLRYNGAEHASDYIPELKLSRYEQEAITKVQTVDDIAQYASSVRKGFTQVDKDAKAVYLPTEDKVFLVLDNIKPTDDLKGIILHEYGVHMNGERVLGTAQFGKMLDRLEDLAVQGNAKAKAAFASVPKDTPAHLVREEALGYFVEANQKLLKDGIISKLVAGVRAALRKSGINLALSENDIMQLVRKAAKGKAESFDATFPYVWHGSPAKGIEQLDTAFMGSGEGQQAFGWGHYLTSEKGTALEYRNKEALRRGMQPDEGGLYRVKINAGEHQFLDLDGRVQSATVQGALDRLGVNQGVTGKTAYDYLAKKFGSQKAASEALVAEGVMGNRYATGRTRRAEVKSSNFVLFSNEGVDMAARYSKPVLTDAAQARVAAADKMGAGLGRKLEWSFSKTFANLGGKAAEIGKTLWDDALDQTGDAVASQSRAIRADLAQPQFVYDDLLANHMASQGAGVRNRIFQWRKSMQVQKQTEKEVHLEMLRRDDLSIDGLPISHANVPEHVRKMADALDNTYAAAAKEQMASGVFGAETLTPRSGFVPRRWQIDKMDDAVDKLIKGGDTPESAVKKITETMAIGIQRKNGWSAEVSSDVATAIYNRTRSKGYFDDSAFRHGVHSDGMNEVRDILREAGVPEARITRAVDKMVGKVDEAGKAPTLKHRVRMSLDEFIPMPDGSRMFLSDFLDTNISTITERYLDNAAASSAFARKGFAKPTDIQTMRKDLLESIPHEAKRKEAAELFDNGIKALRGEPVGERMPDFMRNSLAFTQMMGLSMSGVFQMTEYATMMAQYGAGATMKHVFKEMPIVRNILKDPVEATHLSNMLSRNATQEMRIRPYISRLEDGFDIAPGAGIQFATQQAKQLVPYVNAMKWIQGHQSRVAGNLIMDTFERGAKGDMKAIAALEHYGLESHVLGSIKQDILTNGLDTAKWAEGTWEAVRGPLTKMVDDSVLRSRLGEIPAFAQFTSTGKFLFTFRSFVLGAHNKVLAGTLHNKGAGGLGLILAYQIPLTYLVSATQDVVSGKQRTEGQRIGAAFSQAGSMGLLSEAAGVAFSNKQQFGSPGTIAWDRIYKIGQQTSQGDFKGAAIQGMGAVPLAGAFLPLKALGNALKDDQPEGK